MSSESKLANFMDKNKDLVRQTADIEVDEITFAKSGALGEEANAVVMLKSDSLESEEVDKEEPAAIEKSNETELVAEELTFDDAVSLIRKSELTDEQKSSLVDLTLEVAGEADIEKQDTFPGFTESTLELLNSMNCSIQKLLEKTEAVTGTGFQATNPVTDIPEATGTEKESVELKKESEVPQLSVIEKADMLLRKSLEDKKAHGRASQDAAVLKKIEEVAGIMSGISNNLNETRRTLDRACGKDA